MKIKTILIGSLLFSASLQAATPFTSEQEQRIQELVRETLVNNPQILAEAAEKWNQQDAASNQQHLKEVITKYKDFLFNDKNSPRIGAAHPKLTLVVFTDYNCPYCKKFDPYMEKIVEDHPDVAVVFKFLPFRSKSSVTSARDALTLWSTHPDQFMKFNDILMSKKGYHDDASIEAAKKKAGVLIDTPNSQSLETIKTSLAVAQELGIDGTPATLIGDNMLSGWVPYEQFEQLVAQALNKS